MADTRLEIGATVATQKHILEDILLNLRNQGYETLGPVVQDNAVVYRPLSSMQDLPKGYISEQEAGHYRLVYTGHEDYFRALPGPHTWKQFFFPPRSEIIEFQRDGQNPRHWQVIQKPARPPAYALIGVRPCELEAIRIQDRVFMREDYKDPYYRSRRERAFILLVGCNEPVATCFCTSMGIGPRPREGFDLSLIELEDVFLVQVGSETGRMILANLPWEAASAFWIQEANQKMEQAWDKVIRNMPESHILEERLLDDLDNPHYDDIAKRCISCGNCTLVCPTCFCWDVQEINTLDVTVARRERVWDSCFNPEYSYVFGGNTRPNTRSRYRQWITHKLASWHHQFGTSGCVGCGRCITWCPARIDITEEAAALIKER
jgi:ferredoxin